MECAVVQVRKESSEITSGVSGTTCHWEPECPGQAQIAVSALAGGLTSKADHQMLSATAPAACRGQALAGLFRGDKFKR